MSLWPNGVKALRALGLAARVQRVATRVERIDFETDRGGALFTLPASRLEALWGAPTWSVSRADLLETLLQAARDEHVEICFRSEVTRFHHAGAGVQVCFRAGSSRQADALLGADGVYSSIRSQLFGVPRTRNVYHTGWIGTALVSRREWPLEPGHQIVILGRDGLQACITALGPDAKVAAGLRRIGWYATEKHSSFSEDGPISRGRLVTLYRDWARPLGLLIERSGEIQAFPIFDRFPSLSWGEGAVTLVGDSIHPSTPDLGQGACQCFEGATVLAAEVARSPSNLAHAFRRYERRRRLRAAHVTTASWLTSILGTIEAPGASTFRTLAARTLLPGVVLAEFQLIFHPAIDA